MGKKRERHQNPEPFLPEDTDSIASSTKTRSKASKHHQKQQKMISSGMSSKILKQALIQQKEIQAEERNPNFNALEEELPEPEGEECAEDQIDDFSGFSETQSQFNDYPEEIDENDEKLLEAFLSKDAGPQRTLADLIIEKLKKTDSNVSSELQPIPKLDQSLIDLYKGVGEYLSKYTAGKIPKAFKHIPSMQLWEDILYLTEPQKWSPNAMYQATRIFSSNLGAKKAERFYRLVLLPRVRDDIRTNKRLHFSLYQALKKSLYKPAAFNKGILLPLCKSGTCTLREAVIVGSIIQKVSIPMLHSCVAVLKLAEMEYCGTTRIPIIFEGDLAHIAASHLKKGDFVYIDGQLSTDPPPFPEMPDQTQVQVLVNSINFIEGSFQVKKSLLEQQLEVPLDDDANMKRKGESGSNSWTDLLENPNQWWDYRSSKRSGLVKPKHPDFKHKNNNQSVWLTGAPSWIFSGLEKVKFDVKTALPTQTKQQKEEECWKDLVENPHKWWDNRVDKKNPKSPDFKHKETGEGLWLDTSPAWVLPKLPPTKGAEMVAGTEGYNALLSQGRT